MIRTTIPANEIIHIKHTIEVYSCKQKRQTKGLKKKKTVKLTYTEVREWKSKISIWCFLKEETRTIGMKAVIKALKKDENFHNW